LNKLLEALIFSATGENVEIDNYEEIAASNGTGNHQHP
jgi:hypothetical protein